MKQLNLFIIDDEKSARELMKNLLEGYSRVNILGEAESADQALKEIMKKKPDVLLLDIQMPLKDGFVLVEKLIQHQIQVEIIFITAYEKYAIQAIKASAFDYLLKPVKKTELISTLERLLEKVISEQMNDRFSELINQLSNQKKIKFRNRTGFSMVDPDDILFCQADSNYTILELASGKNLMVSLNLGKVEERLPRQKFCKISRSNVVNMKYLAQVDRKTLTCTLINETCYNLKVTRKYLQNLEMHCNYLFRSN